ncbi:TlpA family protein disulfide reductase [Belliella sp. R4-6]|uniref:TlpA family protein disulfide reductase n=1 Tax=Belliella alkalica TaxID=1730871 RepID=A0ABS9V603_9BACT|nr:TlpA disulfide reductase family protein [Belliella alkalica]MCH7411854.1 TlpA family protein disulfide reductase [Belliella alkalica]
MKKQITLLIIMLLSFYAFGQEKLEPLDIGDQIPNLKFENVLNHPSGEILLSDYRGKLLILDFWATWCAPCVASFPKLDSLDKAFGEDLVILPVTYQSKEDVEKVFSRIPKLKNIKKPMIYGDEVLRHIFPHKTLPHYVWLDAKGNYLTSTNGEMVTAERIGLYLQNMEVPLPNKVAYQEYDDARSLFFENEQINGKAPMLFSVWAPRIVGIRSGYKIVEEGHHYRISVTNLTLASIFKLAYRDLGGYIAHSRVEVISKNAHNVSPKYSELSAKDWVDKGNTYCYELAVPVAQKEDAFAFMRDDISRAFPEFEARLLEKEREVWVLKRVEGQAIPKESSGDYIFEQSHGGFALENSYLYAFTHALEAKWLQHLEMPLIDETGIDYPITMTLETSASDPDQINQALKAYGLALVREKRNLEVLTIMDKPKNP